MWVFSSLIIFSLPVIMSSIFRVASPCHRIDSFAVHYLFIVDLQVGGLDDVGGVVRAFAQLLKEVYEGSEDEAVVRMERVQSL